MGTTEPEVKYVPEGRDYEVLFICPWRKDGKVYRLLDGKEDDSRKGEFGNG